MPREATACAAKVLIQARPVRMAARKKLIVAVLLTEEPCSGPGDGRSDLALQSS